MRKINYHKNPKDFSAFKEEYKKLILGSKLIDKSEVKKLLKSIGVKPSFEEILVLPIEELIKLPEIKDTNLFNGFGSKNGKVGKDKIIEMFNYRGFQTKILSAFFMKHSNDLKIKTCCYCNIDFVNPYIPFFNDYTDFFHLMDNCEKNDLNQINGIGDKFSDLILTKYKGKIKKYDDIEYVVKEKKVKSILHGLTSKSGKINNNNTKIKNKNHFTLDHVLPQKCYPYLSLSLFNLTPSCYSCNSKLKKDTKIYGNLDEISSISPTGINGVFDLIFKIYFKDGFHKKKNLPITTNEYSIKIDSIHKKYIEKLNLQGRYNFHKDIGMDLIEKRKIYSDSQLKEIVRLFEEKNIKVNAAQLKGHIFGDLIFEEDSNEQFEKYKKDIASQLGII